MQNDSNMFVVCPFTHEASKAWGFTPRFAVKCNTGKEMSPPWCTAIGNASHWDSHYHSQHDTLYYVDALGAFKAEIEKTLGSKFDKCAIQMKSNGSSTIWDRTDVGHSQSTTEGKKYIALFIKYFTRQGPGVIDEIPEDLDSEGNATPMQPNEWPIK